MPPRNHGLTKATRCRERWLAAGAFPAAAIGFQQNENRQRGQKGDQRLGEHDGRVVRGERAKRREPQPGDAPRGDANAAGARRAAISAIDKTGGQIDHGLRQHHRSRRVSGEGENRRQERGIARNAHIQRASAGR